jgi:cell division protease FtsH
MVTKWGLSDRMGPLTYTEEEGEVFLGKSVTKSKMVSDETAQAIDSEIRGIIDRNYQRAYDILTENTDKLHLMADALIKYETIDVAQIDAIMDGKEPGPPQDWSSGDSGSSDDGGGSNKAEADTTSSKSKKADLSDPASSH